MALTTAIVTLKAEIAMHGPKVEKLHRDYLAAAKEQHSRITLLAILTERRKEDAWQRYGLGE
jgi:hypothetical protein